jgi:hypothetical protein
VRRGVRRAEMIDAEFARVFMDALRDEGVGAARALQVLFDAKCRAVLSPVPILQFPELCEIFVFQGACLSNGNIWLAGCGCSLCCKVQSPCPAVSSFAAAAAKLAIAASFMIKGSTITSKTILTG